MKRENENLLGLSFERLTVIKRLHDYISPQNIGYPKWRCRCSCGNIKDVLACHLKSGKIKSCGCYRKDKLRERLLDDLINKKFGRLTVLKRDTDHISSSNEHRTRWICKCDCGNYITVWAKSIKSGNTTSCGCATESLIASDLKSYFIKEYNAKKEYKIFKNPKTNKFLFFDIYIPSGIDLKINGVYIEVHGEQHYKINEFHRQQSERNETLPQEEFENQRYRDKIKKKFAKKNGTYIEIDLRKIKSTEKAIIYIKSKMQ